MVNGGFEESTVGAAAARAERMLSGVDIAEVSRDYEVFRAEALSGKISTYEQFCRFSGKLFHVKLSEDDEKKINSDLITAHLRISAVEAASFGVFVGLLLIVVGVAVGATTYLLGDFSAFSSVDIAVIGITLMKLLVKIPAVIASKWRQDVGSQMVLCVLYVVVYMRHTSNLEHAIKFASDHVSGALKLDLMKVFWDVETGKYLTIKESLENYLEQWRGHNDVFVEAFHLIISSLYEDHDNRRVEILDKALNRMLEGMYGEMMHYSQGLKSPVTMLYMLGIILPVLGLVLFPLLGTFLRGWIRWQHVFVLYNLLLPALVYVLGQQLMTRRPTGFGSQDLLDVRPELKQYAKPGAGFFAYFLLAVVLVGIGLLPAYAYFVPMDFPFLGGSFFDFKQLADGTYGPFGLGAQLLSFSAISGLMILAAMYYRGKAKQLIKIRESLDLLEQEFGSALYQFGNRIGAGVPTEAVFQEVAQGLQGSVVQGFFEKVDYNLRNVGMGLEQAIFDEDKGAVNEYPSSLVESTMRVLVEASKKGSVVASRALLTISQYVERIREVNERLRDLLSEVLSGLKSQITFLLPMIAGVVVGMGGMVVSIINKLSTAFEKFGEQGVAGIPAGVLEVLNIRDVIPPYQFQLVVGFYVIEMVVLLTLLGTWIERGYDKTTARYRLGKNLLKGVGLYLIIAVISSLIFAFLAEMIGIGTGQVS